MKKLLLIIIPFYPLLCFGQSFSLIDRQATAETRALYENLKLLSKTGILFGHQHATEYGHGWRGDRDRSDVKSVTGSHPAVIGVDFSGLSGRPEQQIRKEKQLLRKNIEDTYNRGGVTTVSWHFSNPASGGGFYWKDSVSLPAVKLLIPGGSHHEKYKKILAGIADLANIIKGKDGKKVPVIFRPYHEFDGAWFWWGKPYCSAAEFISLWKFTVTYLRDSLSVHNFIYAFSPDNIFTDESTFSERYPGNDWVDMVGMDNYADWGRDGKYDINAGIRKLQVVAAFAQKNDKLAAFTETGLESIPDPGWFTEILLKNIKAANIQLSYVLVWRNDEHSATHYYAPFPGHASAADFIQFYNDPYTIFENDLPDLYRVKK